MAEVANELFGESNPDVQVTVGESGTGGGFEKFCAGETDISTASRPIEEDEVAICEENGVNFQEMVDRQRRPHPGDQQGQRLGDVPHGRAAQDHLGAQGRGQDRRTGTRSTRRSPTKSSPSSEPEPTPERSTTSPTPSPARRAQAAPTTRRPRMTTTPSPVSREALAGSATSGTRTTSRTPTA